MTKVGWSNTTDSNPTRESSSAGHTNREASAGLLRSEISRRQNMGIE
jgi:hypothetical protein